MLKQIPKILSPELVKYLMEMGHGDELVIADANFPGAAIKEFERFEFYEQAKDAYLVIQTGESALYGNIILKKGVL